MGWKCSLKNDCIRSSLKESKSFLKSQDQYQPSRETWYREVKKFRVFVTFISWINKQEEHRLSSAQILTSRYQSVVDNRMKIECASNVVDVMEYSSPNHYIVLKRRINEIASRMSLKSTEVENCSNYQSNTDIFVSILLLQPNKLSIDHQTNCVFVNDDFEDAILSCRIQLLHLLVAVTFDCVEED